MNHPVQLSNVKSFITTRIVPHTSSINATRHSFKHHVRPCLERIYNPSATAATPMAIAPYPMTCPAAAPPVD
jgi:hypothetical protein